MSKFIEGQDRQRVTLLTACLVHFIGEDNPVRAVEAFVSELELRALGFDGATLAAAGRPSHDRAVLLKIGSCDDLNRVASSRHLAPDSKTIADVRRDDGAGMRNLCPRLAQWCRQPTLSAQALMAIDVSRFKAGGRDAHVPVGLGSSHVDWSGL